MKKVIDFCKDKYKLLIPIMVVFVLGISLIFLYNEYKFDNYRNKKEIKVFQSFSSVKTDYTAIVTYNLRDAIVDIKPKDAKIEYDSTPIYYSEEDKVIFPSEMSIVFPLRDGGQFKLYKYSTYYMEDDLHYIKNNVDTGNYSVFFLYNGKNTFFFPYEVDLKVGNKVVEKLSKMSFVTISDSAITYYDYEDDKGKIIETDNKEVTVTSENINVNLSGRFLTSFGRDVLLFSPKNLNPVFKSIDK
ncbi:MAG: hypothetical protein IJO57_01460 [Bacilli bacterium]|nr:hypothetical protein [Bacilli bacterium]